MSTLTTAQAAAERGDWSAIVPILQHFLLEPASDQAATDGDRLLDLALQVLKYGDFQEQWEVAKLFSQLGDRPIAPLITLLQDEAAELESRWFAARILGDLNNPVAIRALVEQLQASDDDDLSQMAAEALANLGTDAIAALTSLLEPSETRLFAAQALAQIQHSASVTPLLTVVTDSNPMIRGLAIAALGNFPDARVPPVLVNALRDPVASVRRAAIAGLAVRTDLSTPLDLVERLSTCLWDLNLSVCQQAALALGRFKDDHAVAALSRVLTTQSPAVLQLDCVRALGWIGTSAALTALFGVWELAASNEGLTSGSRSLVSEIVIVLGRWGEPALKPVAAQRLIEALDQPVVGEDTTLRQAIATALGELKQPLALEPLIQLLADSHPGVRLHAIAALKALSDNTFSYLQQLQTQVSEPLQSGIAVALREW